MGLNLGGAGINGIVMFAIGLTVMAAVVPAAISTIETTDTSLWGTGTASLWALLGLGAVAAVLFRILKGVGQSD